MEGREREREIQLPPRRRHLSVASASVVFAFLLPSAAASLDVVYRHLPLEQHTHFHNLRRRPRASELGGADGGMGSKVNGSVNAAFTFTCLPNNSNISCSLSVRFFVCESLRCTMAPRHATFTERRRKRRKEEREERERETRIRDETLSLPSFLPVRLFSFHRITCVFFSSRHPEIYSSLSLRP